MTLPSQSLLWKNMNKRLTLGSSLSMKMMDTEPSLLSLWKSRLENHALILMVLAKSNIIIVYFFLAQTRWIGIGSIRFVYDPIYFYILKVFLKKIKFFLN